jgi:hypothetical protein
MEATLGSMAASAKGEPHSPQNLKLGGFSVPHCRHTGGASFAPQWPQNLTTAGFSKWH